MQDDILPTIAKLFNSSDRGIKIQLLQNMDNYEATISDKVADQQIFPALVSGFSDSSPYLRELTLKSMVILAPKLSEKTLNSSLLKYLAKLQVVGVDMQHSSPLSSSSSLLRMSMLQNHNIFLLIGLVLFSKQMDEEPAIRTNTTICLGNIAKYLGDSTRKRILLNAFGRALKDTFAPAKAAGLMAINATMEYYETTELASRVIHPAATMSLETDPEVWRIIHTSARSAVQDFQAIHVLH